ncbi:MAG: ExbD/TolR family protein [Paracoccaceae bacterium]
MKLRKHTTRPVPETIVALIDVVFFLLVFFMLVGRMDATSPFDVIPPLSETGSDMPGGGTTVTVAADGRLALDGGQMTRETLLGGIADQIAARPDLFVRINAHREAELRHVLPLVTAIERLGARNVVFVVTPEDL